MIHWNISGNSSLCVGTLHKFIELLYINAQEIGPFPILDYRRRGKARHVEGQTETDERIAKAESATEANTPKSQSLGGRLPGRKSGWNVRSAGEYRQMVFDLTSENILHVFPHQHRTPTIRG